MNTHPAARVHDLAAVADFVRGGGPPVPGHDDDFQTRKSRVEVEQKRLLQWAAQNGALGDRQGLPRVGGAEHWVHHLEVENLYLKETRAEMFLGYGLSMGRFCRGATPSEYLDRIDRHNRIFGDDIRLVRIEDHGGKPSVVTSQRAVFGPPADPNAVDGLMAAKGFEKLTDGTYYDGTGLLIFDLVYSNVIQAGTGEVCPIDSVIQRITAEFGDFLRSDPGAIGRDV